MITITFNIENGLAIRVRDAMVGLYAIPLDEDGKPEFTKADWAKEAIRRMVKRDVIRHEQNIATEAAKATITINDGDIT